MDQKIVKWLDELAAKMEAWGDATGTVMVVKRFIEEDVIIVATNSVRDGSVESCSKAIEAAGGLIGEEEFGGIMEGMEENIRGGMKEGLN